MAVMRFVAPLVLVLLSCLLRQKFDNGFQDDYMSVKGVPEFTFSVPLAQIKGCCIGYEALNRFCRTTMPTGKKNVSFLYLLLLLGGDIEQNPGENHVSCGVCTKKVKPNQIGIHCDKCDASFHSNCCASHMHDMLAGSPLSWLCPSCGFSNFSNSFCNESIESLASTNPFHPLNELSTKPISPTINCKTKYRQHKRPRADKCKLTCLLINCQSIRNKAADVEIIIEQQEPDVTIGNESWLHSGIMSSEIFSDNYNIFRKDRLNDNHGGVFQAVKRDIIVTQCQDLDSDCEIVWTQCQLKNRRSKSLFLASYYRPNKCDIISLDELDKSLFKLGDRINKNPVIVAGDFNAPDINWTDYKTTASSAGSERLLEIIDDHGLSQKVREPTRRQGDTHNILDLVVTNNENMINNVKIIAGISDHDIVHFQVNLSCKKKRCVKRKVFIRKRANVESIKQKLQDFTNHYENSLKTESLDTKWNAFHQSMQNIMDSCIPHKFTSSRYNLPWFNRSLRRQTRLKQKLYNKAKKSGDKADWTRFRTVRKQHSKNLKSARDTYLSTYLTNNMREDPKTFWSYLKRIRQDNPGVEDLRINDEIISEAGLKADALNKQFASVFTKENLENIPTPGNSPTPAIGEIIITIKGVEKQLLSLNPRKASGPDAMPPWFLQENACQIAPILADIYQDSINTGTIPAIWKEANICAVFKKGKKSDPSNYRPISLTCIASKILEHIIHSHFMKHLERYSILADNQHGFRAKRSTETQLICTTHDIAHAIQCNKEVHLAILDFSKAFDKVPHQRLLKKLEYYGVRGSLLEWFKSFLTQRSQVVVCEGVTSTTVMVTSGVPQGTVLGPILFLLYVNDLSDGLKSSMRLFADDALLYCLIENNDVDSNNLQSDLHQIEMWQDRWQMEFNPTKCKIMSITTKKNVPKKQYVFCGEVLEEVERHPYLGVLLDKKMKWSSHISSVTRKANGVLSVIKRNLWNCPREVKETAYRSLVRPKVEYASTVWDPHYKKDIVKVERVQRSAARFCMGNYEQTASVTEMMKTLGWNSLESRRKMARLTMLYKLSRGLFDFDTDDLLTPSQETRTRNSHKFKYRVPRATKDIFKYSFYPRTLSEWNKLPKEIVLADSLYVFKAELKSYIQIQFLFYVIFISFFSL